MNEIVTIRASSLGELLDCPARWEAKHIRKLRLPSSGVAQLGTALHASTAAFDASYLPGGNQLTPADAEGALVDAIHRPEGDVVWDDDLDKGSAEAIGRAIHRKYCVTIAPQQSYVAVEAKCERLEITDLGIALTGTTDRIRKTDVGHGIVDIKSGKTAVSANGSVETAKHAAQLGAYELMAEFATGIAITEAPQVIGLQTGKTDKAQRVGTGTAASAREVLLGEDGSAGLLEYASRIVHGGLFYGNPKSMLCGPKFCPLFNSCRFRA